MKKFHTPHDRLVEQGARWLKYKMKCRPIFSEMTTAAGTTPDVMGWSYGASRLIEVKMSRSDFFADRKKLHNLHSGYSMGRRRWYLVPEGLLLPEDLPEGWGLLYSKGTSIHEVVDAPERLLEPQAQEQEILMLSSAISRLRQGARYSELTGRWESYSDHQKRKAHLETTPQKIPENFLDQFTNSNPNQEILENSPTE